MSVHDANYADEILKYPAYERLERLIGDANKLIALGEIDKEVLRNLTDQNKYESINEKEEKSLAQALRCVETIAKNAHEARHAISEAQKQY